MDAQFAGKPVRRILIIKPSSFGDVIHALPVLSGLRRRFPQAYIAWLVAESCAGLLEGHPELDAIIRFDRRHYGRMLRSRQALRDFLAFVRRLRGERFDLVVDLQGLFRSGFLAAASGARLRVGFGNARELGWLFYTHRVPVDDPQMHAVERNYLFGELLGFSEVPIGFRLHVRAEAKARVTQLLSEADLAPPRPYAVLAPGSRWETKRWPIERFAELVRRLVNEHGLGVVLTGASDERQAAEEVARLAGVATLNLAGQTPLQAMMALIEGSALVVMNDSGPLHLATAFGRPTVGIYGPTSPSRTGPYGQVDSVARLDLPCSPCYLKKLSNCPHAHRCLAGLPVELVCGQIRRVLEAQVRG